MAVMEKSIVSKKKRTTINSKRVSNLATAFFGLSLITASLAETPRTITFHQIVEKDNERTAAKQREEDSLRIEENKKLLEFYPSFRSMDEITEMVDKNREQTERLKEEQKQYFDKQAEIKRKYEEAMHRRFIQEIRITAIVAIGALYLFFMKFIKKESK